MEEIGKFSGNLSIINFKLNWIKPEKFVILKILNSDEIILNRFFKITIIK